MFPSIVVIRFNLIHMLNHFDTQWFYNFHNLAALAATWPFNFGGRLPNTRWRCAREIWPPWAREPWDARNQIETVLMHCSGGTPSMYGLEALGIPRWSLLASLGVDVLWSIRRSIGVETCGALPHLCRRPRLSVWCHGAVQRLRHWNFRARIPLTDEWIFWGSKGWLKAVTMHVLFVSGRHCTIKTSRRNTYIIYYNMWTWSQRIFHSGVPVKTQGKSWASASGYPTTESLSW
jgi:hypothetical protein